MHGEARSAQHGATPRRPRAEKRHKIIVLYKFIYVRGRAKGDS